MFLVEGALAEVNVERGRENLLARIDEHYKSKVVLTGVAAAAGGMFGQVANAASLAMYDGEDTQNFICLIDEQVMCGQFGGAEWLTAGHRVKAIVSRRSEVLFAHAVVDEKQGLLWINHPWGAKAEAARNWKIAWWCYGFLQICWATAYAFLGGRGGFFETMSFGAGVGAVLCFGMALWANRDMQKLADPSTLMFRLLGLKNPEHVNLNGYRISLVAIHDHLKDIKAIKPAAMGMSEYQTRDVYCYQRAIEDGKLAMATLAGQPANA